MTISPAWVSLDGMLYQIFENDISLVEKIFKMALAEVSSNSYLDDEIRQLRLPIDFYEAALLDYAKICPFKPLLGVYGLNNCKEGDIVIHVDFDKMEICSQIAGIAQDMNVEKVQVAVI
jgi:hypothetical protein